MVVVFQLLSHVPLFATPWITAQASLSFTISQSFLRFMSSELVMPSNHLILCCLLLPLPSIFPSIRVFSNELALTIWCQSIGTSASASAPVLPVNIHGWFPLGLTCWISLQFKGLSRVFSNIKTQKHQFSLPRSSLWCNSHIGTGLLENAQLWLGRPLSAK